MRSLRRWLVGLLLVVGMLSACLPSGGMSAPLPDTPTPLPTATPTPTTTPFAPFEVRTAVDWVNVRANPGYLFEIQASVRKGTVFSVRGKSPGGEWIRVENDKGISGWIFAQLLDSPVDLQAVPVIQPENVVTVMGRVADRTGKPIRGIQFMITQGEAPNQQRSDATTDAEGVFYAFLPPGVRGDWVVEYTAIACTSNLMDEKCNCIGGTCGSPQPSKITINLPDFPALVFEWQ
ncbi:MAG: SH3 domain-containing protein [Bellilinea sp.]